MCHKSQMIDDWIRRKMFPVGHRVRVSSSFILNIMNVWHWERTIGTAQGTPECFFNVDWSSAGSHSLFFYVLSEEVTEFDTGKCPKKSFFSPWDPNCAAQASVSFFALTLSVALLILHQSFSIFIFFLSLSPYPLSLFACWSVMNDILMSQRKGVRIL